MRTFTPRLLLAVALVTAILLGFANVKHETHNARGGYVDACGDQPGMVGDDC